MKQKLLLFALLAISANVYSQRLMQTYRNGNIVKTMFVSDVDSVKFGILEDTVIASGTTGTCTWTITGIAGIVGNYTLTISGSGAMDDYYPPSGNYVPWSAYPDNIKTLIIEDGVTKIGAYAFYYHYNLINVTISNSVTIIGDHAFRACRALVNIVIPSSVSTIGLQAFAYCYALTSIDVDAANSSYSSTDGILFNKNKTTLIQYPAGKTGESYTIPGSVTTIYVSAFGSCTNLKDITIPNSVTTIDTLAFTGSGLTNVTIPNSVTIIDWGAFSSCNSLSSVTIGSAVTNIGSIAFQYCTNLTTVTNLSTTPQSIVSDVFTGVTLSNCTLKVPAEALTNYQKADVWKDFGTIEDVNNSGSSPQPSQHSKHAAREPHHTDAMLGALEGLHNFEPKIKRPATPYNLDGEAGLSVHPQHLNGERETIRKQTNK